MTTSPNTELEDRSVHSPIFAPAMYRYAHTKRLLAAVDCIVFGFDGTGLKILTIKRGFEPMKGQWSLMGGFIAENESAEIAAARILKQLTGLENVYLEQLQVFSQPHRDVLERTISVAYVALINIHDYETQITDEYQAEWFSIDEYPALIMDHQEMVAVARRRLQYKAAMHPILFELLLPKFTLQRVQALYESMYDTKFDKGNFMRKLISTGLLRRLNTKDKGTSKKGAYYYTVNKVAYKKHFASFLNIIPNAHLLFE